MSIALVEVQESSRSRTKHVQLLNDLFVICFTQKSVIIKAVARGRAVA